LSYLPEVEAVLEALARDLARLDRVATALEAKGNHNAAYEARAWRLSVGRLYLEVFKLAEALRKGHFLEASTMACSVKRAAYNLYSTASTTAYSFIARPSLPPIASLLNISTILCKERDERAYSASADW
jgi:hypothetical protein